MFPTKFPRLNIERKLLIFIILRAILKLLPPMQGYAHYTLIVKMQGKSPSHNDLRTWG